MSELLSEEDPLVVAYREFDEHQKKFLEEEMKRFFEVYKKTHSSMAKKTYEALLKQRQNCKA